MNDDKRTIKLNNGAWVTIPKSYRFTYDEEQVWNQICEQISKVTKRRIHAVHMNLDDETEEDIEKLRNINIVFNKHDE